MTCDSEYRCDTAVPTDPALVPWWTEGYEFTADRVRYWEDDTVQDDKFAAQSALASELSDTQRAYWGGVLFAIMEFLGERPCPGCDRKEAA